MSQFKGSLQLGLEGWEPPEPLTYTRPASAAFAAGRMDAEFHRPKCDSLRQILVDKFEVVELSKLGIVDNGKTVPYDEDGSIRIIRSGDLSNIDDDNKLLKTKGAKDVFKLLRGDILISSIGFGSIGKVQVFDKTGEYGTVSEVTVVRQNILNPYYLACFLKSLYGQIQIDRYITGATGQLHLYKRDVRKIFVPVLSANIQSQFESLAKQAHAAREQAQALLAQAKRAVEIAIEQGEAAGLAWLSE